MFSGNTRSDVWGKGVTSAFYSQVFRKNTHTHRHTQIHRYTLIHRYTHIYTQTHRYTQINTEIQTQIHPDTQR